MHIDSSYTGMESARSYASVTAASLSAVTQGSVTHQSSGFGGLLTDWGSRFGFAGSQEDEDAMMGLRYTRSGTYSVDNSGARDYAEKISQIRQRSLMYLFNLLFSRRKKGGTTRDGRVYGAQQSVTDGEQNQKTHSVLDDYLKTMPGPKTVVDFSYFHAEKEETFFSTTGKVVTSDGREIEFDLSLSMSRTFYEYYTEHYETPNFDLFDPLVINLNGSLPGLSSQKYTFDLDHDGILDQISMPTNGSGFLALDKNGDGKINDGSELFGTASGNGFAELAAYDDDHDGWIDEDDEIFDKLLIWGKDENGKDVLYHLKDVGIGAICLSSVSTDFSLIDERTGQLNGVVRRTGAFLYEDGRAGTVQHIDVAK